MTVSVSQKAALVCAAFLFLAGCAGQPRLPQGRDAVMQWMAQRSFVAVSTAPTFSLLRQRAPALVLTVYIEGDGAAWSSPYHPPSDPTPTDSPVMDMAAADPSPAVVYLARPCQFPDTALPRRCTVEQWTRGRFASELVEQMSLALDLVKADAGATRLRLIGYSGGGVIATLLAARRKDVDQLVTVAAPLRVAAWTTHHGVTPLTGLDPDALTGKLPPAVHFVGVRDEIVPASVPAPFATRTGGRLVVVPGYDHTCCWSRDWSALLKEIP